MRLVCNAGIAWLIYRLLPVPLDVRQSIIICLLSPVAILSLGFTARMEGNTTLSAMINSVGILVGVAAIFVLIPLLHIA